MLGKILLGFEFGLENTREDAGEGLSSRSRKSDFIHLGGLS